MRASRARHLVQPGPHDRNGDLESRVKRLGPPVRFLVNFIPLLLTAFLQYSESALGGRSNLEAKARRRFIYRIPGCGVYKHALRCSN